MIDYQKMSIGNPFCCDVEIEVMEIEYRGDKKDSYSGYHGKKQPFHFRK